MLFRSATYVLALIVFAGVAAYGQSSGSLANRLKNRHWQSRIVIIYAPTAQQTAFRQQKQLLTNESAGVDERDIVLIDAPGNQLNPTDQTYLQTVLGLSAGRFGVVLIGKDGGVKLRSSEPITAERLFATIDGMSMRQQEIRERKQAKTSTKD